MVVMETMMVKLTARRRARRRCWDRDSVCQASTHHYLTCLDGLLTVNKVAREFEFPPLHHPV
jgi:hypothetical protein